MVRARRSRIGASLAGASGSAAGQAPVKVKIVSSLSGGDLQLPHGFAAGARLLDSEFRFNLIHVID